MHGKQKRVAVSEAILFFRFNRTELYQHMKIRADIQEIFALRFGAYSRRSQGFGQVLLRMCTVISIFFGCLFLRHLLHFRMGWVGSSKDIHFFLNFSSEPH